MTDSKYEKSFIYRIVNLNPNDPNFYIGSTTQNLRERWNNHKFNFNNPEKKGRCKLYKYIDENGGIDNFDLILLEIFDASNGGDEKLRQRERFWTEKLKEFATLNTYKPYISKEELIEYKKEKIPCDICGKLIRRDNISHHKKSIH